MLFEPGRTELHPAAFSLLSGIAGALTEHPVSIHVEGHTDATGNVKGNWELSAMRAVSVVSFMQDRGGIDGRKLDARGYGSFRPASPGGADPTWDRRVELVIQSKSPMAYDAIYKVEQMTGGANGR